MKASMVISFIVLMLLSLSARADRQPATSLDNPILDIASDENPGFEVRAGRVSGVPSSVLAFTLGVKERKFANVSLPSYLIEFHDGDASAWKLELIGLSSKPRDGLYLEWVVATGLTNDCPLCQTDLEQVFLNAGVGPSFSNEWGQVHLLAGFESSSWRDQGRQSLGIPVASLVLESAVGATVVSLSATYSEARQNVKRESELRIERQLRPEIAVIAQGAYRTLTDEDDESKIFVGLKFAAD